MAEMRTETRLLTWSMMYPQMVPVAVASTFFLPLVDMVVVSFSFLQSLVLLRSLGIGSPSTKWSDAPLSKIIEHLSLSGGKTLLRLSASSPVNANPFSKPLSTLRDGFSSSLGRVLVPCKAEAV